MSVVVLVVVVVAGEIVRSFVRLGVMQTAPGPGYSSCDCSGAGCISAGRWGEGGSCGEGGGSRVRESGRKRGSDEVSRYLVFAEIMDFIFLDN